MYCMIKNLDLIKFHYHQVEPVGEQIHLHCDQIEFQFNQVNLRTVHKKMNTSQNITRDAAMPV